MTATPDLRAVASELLGVPLLAADDPSAFEKARISAW
jgi:hypothetical protein